jgi:pimeloyl-ACP methyl ester carboxylesterase
MRLGAIAGTALLLAACGTALAEPVEIEAGGLTLEGELEQGDPGRPTLLIVHGTLAHRGMELIRNLQSLLAERGLGSLAITLSLGLDGRTGMYDCAVPHRHHHGDAPAEIAAWLDWLAAEGKERVVLMGHSRGGNQVAWTLAEAERPIVAGAVLLAPMTWSAPAVAAAYDAASPTPLADLLQRAGRGEQLEGVRFLHCETATVAGDSFTSYYADDPRFDTPTLLAGIEKPILLIAGSEDAVVPDLAERLDGLKQANVATLTVEGADHFFLDLYAEEVADAVDGFVDGLP